jgi:2-C-methyl-D-erythritol 2,4-cyclodiphosphate synthase
MTWTNFRIGHGYDLHRLQIGGKLVLGGVKVSDEISPVAHSDGDVVIHALVDAILGAIGEGDIGEQFPNSDPRWKDADSGIFLDRAVHEMRSEGYRIENIDCTILAERPKLSGYKQAIRENLENLLDTQVNVKAGTNEGVDAIGRGEAIAAHVVVLLAKVG